jgi:hypothetical protein
MDRFSPHENLEPNLGTPHPLTVRLAVNSCICALGLALGVWLVLRGLENTATDTPFGLVFGAFLVVASLMLFQSSLRFFFKHRR